MRLIAFSVFLIWTTALAEPALRLSWDEYRRQYMEQPRLKATLADTTLSPQIRNLAIASNHFDENRFDSALVAYQSAQNAIAEIADLVQIRMARCEMELGKAFEARVRIQRIKALASNQNWWEQADRILLESLLKDSTIAVEVRLDSLEARTKTKAGKDYLAWIRFKQAELAQKKLQQKSALAYYIQAMKLSTPLQLEAFDSAKALTERVGLVENINLRVDYVLQECQSAKPERCLVLLDSTLRNSTLTRDARIRLIRQQANVFRIHEDTDSAAVRYQWLMDSVEARPDYVQALLRLRRKQGLRAEAKKLEQFFKEKFPFSNENANALWVRAFEFEQDSQYDSALVAYDRLMDKKFGDHLRKQWAPVRKGLIWFKQKKWNEAYGALDSAAKNPSYAWPQAAALFFQAEAMRRSGVNSLATIKYQATIQAFPLSWYAWRARMLLQEHQLLDSTKQVPWLQLIPMSRDSAVLWLQNQIPKATKRKVHPANLVSRIELLLRTGFDAEAYSQLEDSFKLYSTSADFLFEAGSMLLNFDEIGESYKFARRFFDLMDRKDMGVLPLPVAQWLYPKPNAWFEYIRECIGTDSLQPLFVLGLMRQESIFQSDIRSPVGARGLMQIMPQTGRTLAKLESLDDFHPDHLHNPFMSIRLGVRYLKDLLAEYKDPVYVLANYNAGPAPAKRWLKANGKYPLELEVEEISYWETRDYVKKVMGNLWTYQAVWGNP